MFKIRPKDERGKTKLDWLDSSHTFSFADYYDLENMGFSDLRVINDDIVSPKGGFGLHPHANMEILSVILSGSLEHKDSMGNVSIIGPGEIQKMSAGTGIYHSEYNPSDVEPVHFLQIWIIPDTKNLKPYYEQKHFNLEKKPNELVLIGSKNGKHGSLKISQNIEIYQAVISEGKSVSFMADEIHKYWIQIAEGVVEINNNILEAGDGAAIKNETKTFEIKGIDTTSNILIFQMRE